MFSQGRKKKLFKSILRCYFCIGNNTVVCCRMSGNGCNCGCSCWSCCYTKVRERKNWLVVHYSIRRFIYGKSTVNWAYFFTALILLTNCWCATTICYYDIGCSGLGIGVDWGCSISFGSTIYAHGSTTFISLCDTDNTINNSNSI